MDLNTGAVPGIISVGSGYYNLEEALTCMNIPCMSQKTYQKYENKINNAWEQTASQKMDEAFKKIAEYTKETGRVGVNGIPLITVVGDGWWSKRSYGINYKALSEVVALIGHDEALLQILSTVLAKECPFTGYLQPPRIGQRPKIVMPNQYPADHNSATNLKRFAMKKHGTVMSEILYLNRITPVNYNKYVPQDLEGDLDGPTDFKDNGINFEATATYTLNPSIVLDTPFAIWDTFNVDSNFASNSPIAWNPIFPYAPEPPTVAINPSSSEKGVMNQPSPPVIHWS
ncbi:hypothetical protein CBL_11618 [Carabus blaptoides fortunei]